MGVRSDDHNETRVKLEEALAVLTAPSGVDTALPDLAASLLYGAALSASKRGSLTLGLLTATLAGAEGAAWFALQEDMSRDKLMHEESLVRLASRMAGAGGDIAVVFNPYPIPDRETIMANAERLASPAQLEGLANGHIRAAYDAHATGDFEAGARESREALRFLPTARAATMAAHFHMLVHDYGAALLYAQQALELARREDEGRIHLAGYDVAATLLLTGDESGAEEMLKLVESDDLLGQDASNILVDLERDATGTWRVTGDRSKSTREAAAVLVEMLRAPA